MSETVFPIYMTNFNLGKQILMFRWNFFSLETVKREDAGINGSSPPNDFTQNNKGE